MQLLVAAKTGSAVDDSVGVVKTVFPAVFEKTVQRSPLVRIRVSRAPFFGVHLDP